MATTGSGRIEVREGGAFHGEFHLSDGTEVECVGSVGASSLPAFETSEASITYENAPEGATFLTGAVGRDAIDLAMNGGSVKLTGKLLHSLEDRHAVVGHAELRLPSK
ncbi:hypothetical protein [Streptomyces cinereospinus]|uniref:DUF3224 domain-containing protein n=1 Tax=Streptomyces cinereospinus TaxID=285561 RepID=A0ABV5N959_9ACTN